MLRFQRTYRFKAGKDQEAMGLAKEAVEHVKRTYGPLSLEVMVETFGDLNAIHWCLDMEDMAGLQRLFAEMREDQVYLGLVAKGAKVWIDGSGHDTLMESI